MGCEVQWPLLHGGGGIKALAMKRLLQKAQMTLTSPDVLHDQNIVRHLAKLLCHEGQRRVHCFDNVPARNEPQEYVTVAGTLQKLGCG